MSTAKDIGVAVVGVAVGNLAPRAAANGISEYVQWKYTRLALAVVVLVIAIVAAWKYAKGRAFTVALGAGAAALVIEEAAKLAGGGEWVE